MAHIRSAIVCDFAQVREGLLFVSSGGITRISFPQWPGQASFCLAGQLEVANDEVGQSHTVNLRVTEAQTATDVWLGELNFHAGQPPPLFPGEPMMIPFALSIGPVQVERPGPYDINVSGESDSTLLTLYLLAPGDADESVARDGVDE